MVIQTESSLIISNRRKQRTGSIMWT